MLAFFSFPLLTDLEEEGKTRLCEDLEDDCVVLVVRLERGALKGKDVLRVGVEEIRSEGQKGLWLEGLRR